MSRNGSTSPAAALKETREIAEDELGDGRGATAVGPRAKYAEAVLTDRRAP